MKKYILLFCLILILTMSIFSVISTQAGNLECSDITNCSGSANCGGSGTPVGCVLLCEGGGDVVCDEGEHD